MKNDPKYYFKKRFLKEVSLSSQIAAVIFIVALIPTAILSAVFLARIQQTAERERMLETDKLIQRSVFQAQRAAELCGVSTQTFINTPDLKEYLIRLSDNEKISAEDSISFYRSDITSLEKLVIANPYLYQIRVYSSADDINEMMPVLYSGKRMEKMPWSKGYTSGSWYFDYTDALFQSGSHEEHIASYITDIENSGERIGTIEASISLAEIMPELYSSDQEDCTFLLSDSGEIVGDVSHMRQSVDEIIYSLSVSDGIYKQRLSDGKTVLVGTGRIDTMNCVYVHVQDMSKVINETAFSRNVFLCVLSAVFILLAFLINKLVNRMMKGLYRLFDCINDFAEGQTDVKAEVYGNNEISRMAVQVNTILDRIRQLMADNLAREMLAKESQLKALQNQINAHFIYNALESIRMMAEIDEKYEIADAVTNLGKLLRYGMKWTSGEVSLSEELEYVRNYLSLMNLRFDNEVIFNMNGELSLMTAYIPKMSIQPIVENAVVHGLSGINSDTVIDFTAEKCGDRLIMKVTDHGCGLDEEQVVQMQSIISGKLKKSGNHSNGIGLNNVQERINTAYGDGFGIFVESVKGEYTSVTVEIPYITVQS